MDTTFDYEAMEQKRAEDTRLWSAKLVGKKLIKGNQVAASDSEFSEASLPQPRRILHGEHAVMTMDFRPERINVRVDDQGICTEVFFV
ncbi:hypothetical protein GGI12_005302 [Dipsacomyces acuminosporus]|nr:hypothetical protein GGI12_005302 [Dipsacomyces acuminosporus]